MTAAVIREKHDGALGDHSSVRLWLWLLSCTMVIEKRVRRRLGERFDTRLPRFDVLTALDRSGAMTMGALSQALLVSKGHVAALVRTLKADGLIELEPSSDRRASIVRLTSIGATQFDEMAATHCGWIDAMLATPDADEREQLFALLGRSRHRSPQRRMPYDPRDVRADAFRLALRWRGRDGHARRARA